MKLKTTLPIWRWTAAGTAVLCLSACGGGTEILFPVDTPPATVPPSATASPRAYTLYAGSLVPSESSQPVLLTDVVAPTTETEEPLALD
jgi:hypothetical protein